MELVHFTGIQIFQGTREQAHIRKRKIHINRPADESSFYFYNDRDGKGYYFTGVDADRVRLAISYPDLPSYKQLPTHVSLRGWLHFIKSVLRPPELLALFKPKEFKRRVASVALAHVSYCWANRNNMALDNTEIIDERMEQYATQKGKLVIWFDCSKPSAR